MSNLGALMAFLAAVFWALASVFYGKGMTDSADMMRINSYRTPLALIVLTIYTSFMHGVYVFTNLLNFSVLMFILLATIIMNVVGDTLYLLSIRSIGVSKAFPLSYTYPLLVTFLSIFLLGEELNIILIFGIAISLAGIKIMADYENSDGGSIIGYLFALGASVSWGVGIIIYKIIVESQEPLIIATIKLAFLALISTTIANLRDRTHKHYSRISVKYLLLGGLFGLGLGDLFFYISLQDISASVASAITTSSPFLSQLLAVILLKETVSGRTIIGTILIVIGLLIVILC